MRLTLETKRTICEAVRSGMSLSGAARLAGVHPGQTQQWLHRAMTAWDQEDPDDTELLYIDFATEVLQALGQFEQEQVEQLLMDAQGDWRARAWLLERRFGKDWAAKAEARVVHEVDGTLEVQHSGRVQVQATEWATPERLQALVGMADELGLTRTLALEPSSSVHEGSSSSRTGPERVAGGSSSRTAEAPDPAPLDPAPLEEDGAGAAP